MVTTTTTTNIRLMVVVAVVVVAVAYLGLATIRAHHLRIGNISITYINNPSGVTMPTPTATKL